MRETGGWKRKEGRKEGRKELGGTEGTQAGTQTGRHRLSLSVRRLVGGLGCACRAGPSSASERASGPAVGKLSLINLIDSSHIVCIYPTSPDAACLALPCLALLCFALLYFALLCCLPACLPLISRCLPGDLAIDIRFYSWLPQCPPLPPSPLPSSRLSLPANGKWSGPSPRPTHRLALCGKSFSADDAPRSLLSTLLTSAPGSTRSHRQGPGWTLFFLGLLTGWSAARHAPRRR
ncbi:uncharacterized protein K452DRAFT_173152 [Aplosporella prunicola CBS 121167]|uniref:Uncharacterized protein n=1 Tax=Aplosporella prunicola CBS 121167 TaxID=1176127 RepID=A0A6A6AWC0_9PEZI|nr:uncharacterized protein K452DRAFT_173152 [Aplosporella prunicola CBS 121167]KAF2135558.1 hypothetical protein K452DRAFT_173152 [Aplosporella prunicola CBS 121167]